MIDALHSINLPAALAQLTQAFERYEAALIANDIAVLDELFWNDDRAVRYGADENLYGYPAIREFRQQRSALGLKRRLLKTSIVTYGHDFGTTHCEFERAGRIGRQSQTWMRTLQGWRIVAAHISMLGSAR